MAAPLLQPSPDLRPVADAVASPVPCDRCAVATDLALTHRGGDSTFIRLAINRLLWVCGDSTADRLADHLARHGFVAYGDPDADETRAWPVDVIANGDPNLVVCAGWSEWAARGLIVAVQDDGVRLYPAVDLSYIGGRRPSPTLETSDPRPGRRRRPHLLRVTFWPSRRRRGAS